jgi:hypothetical protein
VKRARTTPRIITQEFNLKTKCGFIRKTVRTLANRDAVAQAQRIGLLVSKDQPN